MNAGEFARRRARIEGEQGARNRGRGRGFKGRALRALAKRARAAYIVPNGRRIGFRLPDGSVACVKHRFRDQGAAHMELQRIARHASHGYVPVRAYRCEWCGGFHLTSRAQ